MKNNEPQTAVLQKRGFTCYDGADCAFLKGW
jgi:hypothetical protein